MTYNRSIVIPIYHDKKAKDTYIFIGKLNNSK